MVQRIIGVKGAAPRASAVVDGLKAAGPSVHYVRIDEGSAGQRLDNFLIKLLKGVPKSHVHRVIRCGEVRVNQGRAAADTRLALGDKIRVPPVRVATTSDPQAVPPRDFAILFEDEHLIAIDKPAGVAVHGGSGVSYGVIEQLRRARPQERFLELVHRLDKETSGVLLVARKRASLVALQEQLRQRDKGVAKTYLALVVGAWPDKLKVIDVALLKTLNAEGERRVRVVDAQHQDARRSITLVKVQRRFAESHIARSEPEDRAHAPDPRPLGERGPRHRRRFEVRQLRAEQGAWRAARLGPASPGSPARRASTACSCTPRDCALCTPPAARPWSSNRPCRQNAWLSWRLSHHDAGPPL